MDFDDVYGYDSEVAKGKWFDVDGIKVKIAFSDLPHIEELVHSKRQALREKLGRELKHEEHEQIGLDVFVEHVMLDWDKNVKLNGVPLPCTIENKKLIARKYHKFLNQCLFISQNNKMFRDNLVEETTKKF